MMDRKLNAIIAILSVALVVPVAWMLLDRDPPYVRTEGEIVAVDPDACGIPPVPSATGQSRDISMPIRAGGCVEVKWSIKTIRNCPASGGGDNITRHLRDSTGVVKPIGSLRRNLSEHEIQTNTVRQLMVLPAPIPAGSATYASSACYACNPLQQLFWPVCVDQPDIEFEIVK